MKGIKKGASPLECPLEIGLRGIMSYCIGAEGTKNIQRIVIARELLGREYLPYK